MHPFERPISGYSIIEDTGAIFNGFTGEALIESVVTPKDFKSYVNLTIK